MDAYGVGITLKADGAAPWITINVENPQLAEAAVDSITSQLLEKVNGLSSLFAAAYQAQNQLGGQQIQQQVQQYQQPVQNGNGPAAQQAQNRWGGQPQQPQGGQGQGGHPEGKTCQLCGASLVSQATKNGGTMWKCPNFKGQKDAGGNWIEGGNGHAQEFSR